MNSGLYACAGASATASAAACAKRFDDPITNESKVYLSFSPSTRGATGVSGSVPSSRSGSITANVIRRSSPTESRTAASIKPRKCPSIHSRAKSFGTRRVKASSESSTPSTSENHVRKVDSLSALRSRSETSVHRSSAVSNCWRSTPRGKLLSTSRKEGEHSSVFAREQCPPTTCRELQKVADFQAFPGHPQRPPQLWRSRPSQ